ncbi:MAG: succinate dehydrogenase, partial [Acidobacteriota bacterium]|nr:succinate dehydrogenase [Acidobacteriota bacterium]
FWADPPNCAVGEPRSSYWGENSFPLIVQNLHRYFLIFAVGLIVFLTLDVWNALWFEDTATGSVSFGIGIGTLVLAINVILLASYTFGCHSLRHLVGGKHDCIASSLVRRPAYDCVSCLNRRHMMFAWFSLVWVGFSDVYVRLCAMGILTDLRLL